MEKYEFVRIENFNYEDIISKLTKDLKNKIYKIEKLEVENMKQEKEITFLREEQDKYDECILKFIEAMKTINEQEKLINTLKNSLSEYQSNNIQQNIKIEKLANSLEYSEIYRKLYLKLLEENKNTIIKLTKDNKEKENKIKELENKIKELEGYKNFYLKYIE